MTEGQYQKIVNRHSDDKALVFDIDGTLIKTNVNNVLLSDAVHKVMCANGVPKDVVTGDMKTLDAYSKGSEWVCTNIGPEAMAIIDEMIAEERTSIEMAGAIGSELVPGTEDVLHRAKQKKLKLGILTKGGKEYVTKILSEHGILDMFDAIITRDMYPEKDSKPSPMAMIHMAEHLGVDVKDITYFGDHVNDYRTAMEAGAEFIGVLTGSSD